MKRIGFSLLLGVIFLTLQSTLLTSFPIQRIRPDIVLILILYWGLFYPPISGGILAFFMGFLMDLFSGNSFGLYTLSKPFIFYLAQFFKGRFYIESITSSSFSSSSSVWGKVSLSFSFSVCSILAPSATSTRCYSTDSFPNHFLRVSSPRSSFISSGRDFHPYWAIMERE